jgi:hypothetical protein
MRAIQAVRFSLLIPSVVLAAVGCADLPDGKIMAGPSLYNPEVAPSATILFPTAGDTLTAGETVEVVGMVADADGERSTLTAAWYFNGEPICEGITPAEDGLIVCDFTPEFGTGDLTLQVVDADGIVSEAGMKVEIEAGTEPAITISGPKSQRNYTDHAVEFTGRIAGDGELTLSLNSSADGPEVFDIEVSEDGSFHASAILSEGDHVITASVESDNGATGIDGTTVYVGGPNSAPDCMILTPGEGEPVVTGELSSMTGDVGDQDQGAAGLRVVWSSDIDGYLGEGQIDEATGIASMDRALTAGSHQLKLTVFDEVGAGCEDVIEHVVGAPAELQVSGPDGIIDEGQEVEFQAVFDGSTGDRLVWSIGDRSLGTSRIDASGVSTFTTAQLPAGSWTVTAELIDSVGWTIDAEMDVVVNGRPKRPELSGGGNVTANQVLRASLVQPSIDPEGSTVEHRYAWFVNGVRAAMYDGLFFPASQTELGDEVILRAVGNDGRIDSEPVEVAFRIVNAAPVIDAVTMSPAAPTSADTVVCAAASTDADGDTLEMSYAWMVDGALVGSGSVLSAGQARGGSKIDCLVQATDGMDKTQASTGAVLVAHSAPSIDMLNFDVFSADTDTVLRAVHMTSDIDGDAVSVEYSWTVNGVSAGDGIELDGADAFDSGDTVLLTATPVDEYDRGAAATVSLVISDSAPQAPSVGFEADTSREGDDLVCVIDVPAVDVDGDAISYSFQWMLDGRAWDGGTADTYEAGDTIEGADVTDGDEWTCMVEAIAGDASAGDSASRDIERALEEVVVEYTMDDLVGADDTCTGAEAVADGSLTEVGSDVAYIALPLRDLPSKRIYEMDVTVEAAACGESGSTPNNFVWAVSDIARSEFPAVGEASLAVDSDCTCPDAGEVLEMSAEVSGIISAEAHELILGIDADSFSLIEDSEGTVVTVSYWH